MRAAAATLVQALAAGDWRRAVENLRGVALVETLVARPDPATPTVAAATTAALAPNARRKRTTSTFPAHPAHHPVLPTAGDVMRLCAAHGEHATVVRLHSVAAAAGIALTRRDEVLAAASLSSVAARPLQRLVSSNHAEKPRPVVFGSMPAATYEHADAALPAVEGWATAVRCLYGDDHPAVDLLRPQDPLQCFEAAIARAVGGDDVCAVGVAERVAALMPWTLDGVPAAYSPALLGRLADAVVQTATSADTARLEEGRLAPFAQALGVVLAHHLRSGTPFKPAATAAAPMAGPQQRLHRLVRDTCAHDGSLTILDAAAIAALASTAASAQPTHRAAQAAMASSAIVVPLSAATMVIEMAEGHSRPRRLLGTLSALLGHPPPNDADVPRWLQGGRRVHVLGLQEEILFARFAAAHGLASDDAAMAAAGRVVAAAKALVEMAHRADQQRLAAPKHRSLIDAFMVEIGVTPDTDAAHGGPTVSVLALAPAVRALAAHHNIQTL